MNILDRIISECEQMKTTLISDYKLNGLYRDDYSYEDYERVSKAIGENANCQQVKDFLLDEFIDSQIPTALYNFVKEQQGVSLCEDYSPALFELVESLPKEPGSKNGRTMEGIME